MLYRFEVLDGEGFIQELDEYGVCEETQDILLENFNNNLTVPSFKRGVETKSYFTEKAISLFEKDIDNLIHYWKKAKGVEIVKLTVSNVSKVYYKDELQVLELI